MRRNPCTECVLSRPVNDTIGSLKDGDRYYFILQGKQRVCRPIDKNCQKIKTTKGGRPKKKQGRYVNYGTK